VHKDTPIATRAATIAKELTTIVIESRIIFSIFHLTVNINRIL
jgi:hypothetical protein